MAAARHLLGCTLTSTDGVALRIVEVEAYGRHAGVDDPASHLSRAHREQRGNHVRPPGTLRVSQLRHPPVPGTSSAATSGEPAFSMWATEVTAGEDLVRARRAHRLPLASGPGNVGAALAISWPTMASASFTPGSG